jgi:hypothetical protein
MPALSLTGSRISVETISSDTSAIDGLSAAEVALLSRHARYGCLSLVCRTAGGNALPFILQHLRIRKGWISVPAMQLIYCRDIAEFVQCAGPIGRRLLFHGKISVVLDANGPISGLLGLYAEFRGRKFFKGPHRPRLADLTDTELVLYGP